MMMMMMMMMMMITGRCQSIQDMKTVLPRLRQELDQPDLFREIYQFSFLFSREENQKSLRMFTLELVNN